jgi:CHASE2 domain-containing sensor protein
MLAGAMGIRNAAVRSFGVPDLTTTVLTLTLTGLAADAGKPGARSSAPRRGLAVISMLVGGLTGALLLKTGLWLPLAVALLAVAVTMVGYARATRSAP